MSDKESLPTLGNYKKLAIILFGVDSPAVNFLQEKIEKSKIGESEAVLVDELQMLTLLDGIHSSNVQKRGKA